MRSVSIIILTLGLFVISYVYFGAKYMQMRQCIQSIRQDFADPVCPVEIQDLLIAKWGRD